MAQKKRSSSADLSYDTKTIITILLLLFFYPLGVIFTFLWMKWPSWVKVVILTPAIVTFLTAILFIYFLATNPQLFQSQGHYYSGPHMVPLSPGKTAY